MVRTSFDIKIKDPRKRLRQHFLFLSRDLLHDIIPPCVSSSAMVEGRSGWVIDDRGTGDLLGGLSLWFRGSEFRSLLFNNLNMGLGMSYLTNVRFHSVHWEK